MANKRCFNKKITESDAFLDMPLSTQCLYFHLNMYADDDGFVNSPKKVLKMIGANENDMNVLLAKSFIIKFDTGVIVIKHWLMHNTLQNDRYLKTAYQEELKSLGIKENKAYTLLDEKCIQNVYILETQPNQTKPNQTKNNIFTKPTIEELESYCKEKGYVINCEYFWNYYESKGWLIGKTKMKNWKSTLAMWNSRNKNTQGLEKPNYSKIKNKVYKNGKFEEA